MRSSGARHNGREHEIRLARSAVRPASVRIFRGPVTSCELATMPIPIPPLPPLRLFEAAARHESFTQSRGRARLDRKRGQPRHRLAGKVAGRRVVPTPAPRRDAHARGQSSAAPTSPRRWRWSRWACSGCRDERASGASSSAWHRPSRSGFWFRGCRAFATLHPGIRLAIDTSHRQALFPMEGVDLSIRMGRGAWPGVKSDLLFREQLVPVATPAYLAVRPPRRRDQLAEGHVSSRVLARK